MGSNEENKTKSSIDKLFDQSDNIKIYQKRQLIFQEHVQVKGIFRVQKGRVKIWRHGPGFTRSHIFYFIHAFEPFGIIDFFTEAKKRRCSATAMDDEVIVQFVHLSEVQKSINSDSEFGQEIFNLIASSKQIIAEKYSVLKTKNMNEKVFRALQNLAKRKGTISKTGIMLPHITHKDLSDYIGITRQSITASLTGLKKAGLIDYNRRWILVKENLDLSTFIK